MNDKTKTGLEILQAAILLGITGDLLLRELPWGLNFFLWIILLVAAMVTIKIRRKTDKLTSQSIALHGALVFFALMYIWRDSEELMVFRFLAMLGIFSLLTLPVLKVKLEKSGVFHYAVSGMYAGLNAAFAPFFLLFDDIKWKSLQKDGWSKHLISVIRGLAIAAPILFIFGALFMAADAVFEKLVQNTFNIVPESVITHSILIGFLTWIVAGYLRAVMFEFSPFPNANPNPNNSIAPPTQTLSITENISEELKLNSEANFKTAVNPQNQKPKLDWRNFDNTFLPKFFTLGLVETSVILGLINLLFLAFVIVQLPYLFGGMDLVQATPDFKLAEYARRGFGELVVVSALVLPILLFSHWLLRKDSPINEKVYRVLAAINIGLLFVIMISAMQRLLLYTGNLGYGLTTDRFYPMAFMLFLAMVFVWFAMTIFRGARQQFAWGTVWIALFVLGTLHVFNPDDFIVRTNVNLMKQGRIFDAGYNSNLSDDAIPAMIESMDLVKPDQKCAIKLNLTDRLNEARQENDFRTWNYSRWIARHALVQNAQKINTAGCPMRYSESHLD